MPLICCLVCSWIMPAMASEPPDGISTVVSARRVLIEGMVRTGPSRALQRHGVFGRQVGHFRHHLQADAAFRQHHRREDQAHAEFLEIDLRLADRRRLVVSHDSPLGIGNSPPATKLAVSPEIAVRFGSASVRITPARSIARSVAVMLFHVPVVGGVAERLTGGGERILRVEVHHGGAVIEAAAEVDAELLDHVALHFGDRHLEHDLVASAHGDAVDHLGVVADQPRGEIEGLLRLRRRSRRCRRA